ncbi:hypothetical protein PROPEN_03096 [Proteus penneri ATCC 35198]|nr:hypothetical protein PROPEN_03096 [Proteus penneri ATCC 35198]
MILKNLLYPIKLTARIDNITLNPSNLSQGVINQNIVYPNDFALSKTSENTHEFKTTSSQYAIDKECRIKDSGHGVFKLTIDVYGNKQEITKNFNWNGFNGTY